MLVAAGLTIESIGVGAAPHFVVATAAKQLIFAAATQEQVVGAERIGIGIRRQGGSEQKVAKQHVFSFSTIQDFLAEVSVEKVAAWSTEKFVSHERKLGHRRIIGVGIEKVCSLAAKQPLPNLLVGLWQGEIPGVAEQSIATAVAQDKVDAFVSVHDVIVSAATDNVVARSTGEDDLFARSTVEVIGFWTETAEQSILLAAAKQPVGAETAFQQIKPVVEFTGKALAD